MFEEVGFRVHVVIPGAANIEAGKPSPSRCYLQAVVPNSTFFSDLREL